MHWPCRRVTVGRLMAVVAVLAVVLSSVTRFTRISARRTEYQRMATYYAWRGAEFRPYAQAIQACPMGRRENARNRNGYPQCEDFWHSLKWEYRTSHDLAARSLGGASDILARRESRYQRAANAWWPRLPPANPDDETAARNLMNGQGVIDESHFRSL